MTYTRLLPVSRLRRALGLSLSLVLVSCVADATQLDGDPELLDSNTSALVSSQPIGDDQGSPDAVTDDEEAEEVFEEEETPTGSIEEVAARGELAGRMQALAESLAAEGDEARAEESYARFQQIDASEIEAFIEASASVDAARFDAMVASLEGVAATKKPKLRTKKLVKLRKEINRLSMQEYGKPYNQIDADQTDRLFPLLEGDYSSLGMPSKRGVQGVAARATCAKGTFPGTAWRRGASWSGVKWSTYYKRRVSEKEDDCDYVFAYRGRQHWLRPMNWADSWLVNSMGGGAMMRHTSNYTDIVLGYGRILLIYGHPWLVTLRMH